MQKERMAVLGASTAVAALPDMQEDMRLCMKKSKAWRWENESIR